MSSKNSNNIDGRRLAMLNGMNPYSDAFKVDGNNKKINQVEKKSPILKKTNYDEKVLCWYIVVWSNKDIKGTQKVGTIFGRMSGIEGRRRLSFNNKTRDVEIAEKYALIGKMKGKDFKEYMKRVEV